MFFLNKLDLATFWRTPPQPQKRFQKQNNHMRRRSYSRPFYPAALDSATRRRHRRFPGGSSSPSAEASLFWSSSSRLTSARRPLSTARLHRRRKEMKKLFDGIKRDIKFKSAGPGKKLTEDTRQIVNFLAAGALTTASRGASWPAVCKDRVSCCSLTMMKTRTMSIGDSHGV